MGPLSQLAHWLLSTTACSFAILLKKEEFYARSKFKLDTRIEPEIQHFIRKCVVCRRRLDSFARILHAQLNRTATPPERHASKEFLRAGLPGFEQYRRLINVEGVKATQTSWKPGVFVTELTAVVRNSTGQTISELEIRGVVFNERREPGRADGQRDPRTTGVLEPNGTMKARIVIEGLPRRAHRKGIDMEVTGVRFE